MTIAYPPHGTHQDLSCLQERRGIVAALRRLAATLEQIPAFAPAARLPAHPGFLRVVAPLVGEQEGEEA